jgi:hypothetical protein
MFAECPAKHNINIIELICDPVRAIRIVQGREVEMVAADDLQKEPKPRN